MISTFRNTATSRINHSCVLNCFRTFIGDMLILRAAQDLPKNTELGFWYMDPREGEKDRTPHRERMLQQWGVNCSCTFCDTEQKTPVSKKIKRIQILNKLSKQGIASPELLTELEKTYIKPPTEVPQFDAFHSWHSLALTGYERNHTMD